MNNLVRNIVLTVLVILAAIPLGDLIVLSLNSLKLNFKVSYNISELGQMGDFFGGHTAAFSGLLSVALILYFSSRQSEQQQEHFEKQLIISKQTADLTSLSNIYNHYDSSYGETNDVCSILKYVAAGHRKWAIRESFSIIDPEGALEHHRKEQVLQDFTKLVDLLAVKEIDQESYKKIAELTSSLLLDKRLVNDKRSDLWSIYEMLRENPQALINTNSELCQRFNKCRFSISDHYRA